MGAGWEVEWGSMVAVLKACSMLACVAQDCMWYRMWPCMLVLVWLLKQEPCHLGCAPGGREATHAQHLAQQDVPGKADECQTCSEVQQ